MEIKMSRFDNSPWGFRVHGGIDFGAPLRIQKVSTISTFLCEIKALSITSKYGFMGNDSHECSRVFFVKILIET